MSTSPVEPNAPETVTSQVEELRRLHNVRPLEPREEGCAIGSLPNGVYGFSYAPGQDEVPVFSKRSFHSFEIHKRTDGAGYLIGFVTSAEARDIESGNPVGTIQLFPDAWEKADCLVSVPISRVTLARRLPREAGNPLPVTIG